MSEYEKIKYGNRLSTTTIDLLHLKSEFGKMRNVKDEVMVHLVNNQLQKIDTDTCGIFQLCFYMNLLTPVDGSSIIHDKNFRNLSLKNF